MEKNTITPHKGGRTATIFVRATPDAKRKFVELCGDKSQGDWLEEIINKEYEKIKNG